jgi:hypothetical protein
MADSDPDRFVPPGFEDVPVVPMRPDVEDALIDFDADRAEGNTFVFDSDEEFDAWLASVPYLPAAS